MPDDVQGALSAPAYHSAFKRALIGEEALWTEEERDAVRRAKTATGHHGPGLPVPVSADPTSTPDQE